MIAPASYFAAAQHWLNAEIDRLQAERPDHVAFAITLQPNSAVPRIGTDDDALDLIEAPKLYQFAGTVDRVHLGFGPRYRRMRRRSAYVVVGQRGLSGALHWHGAVLVERDKVEAFQAKAAPVWRAITQGGSLSLQDSPDQGWTSYALRHHADPQRAFLCHTIPGPRRH